MGVDLNAICVMWCLLFVMCVCAVYLRIVVCFAWRSRGPRDTSDFDQVCNRDCQRRDGAGSQEPCRIYVGKAAGSAAPTRIFSVFGSGDSGASSVCRTRAPAPLEEKCEAMCVFSSREESTEVPCSSLTSSRRLRRLASLLRQSSHARPCESSLQAPLAIGSPPCPPLSGELALPRPQQQ